MAFPPLPVLSDCQALFRRETTARVIAVEGLLRFLHAGLRQGAEGGGGGGGSGGGDGGGGDEGAAVAALSKWRQIVGLLHRVLGQQREVRAALYRGVTEVYRSSAALRPQVSALLLPHLRKYLAGDEEKRGSDAPLDLGACVSQVTAEVIEPMPLLLRCLQQCEAVESQPEVNTQLVELRQHLVECELESWACLCRALLPSFPFSCM